MQILCWWIVLAAFLATTLADDDVSTDVVFTEDGSSCNDCNDRLAKCESLLSNSNSTSGQIGGKDPHPVGSQGAVLISRGRPANHISQWAGQGLEPTLPWRAVDGEYETNLIGTKKPCSITLHQPNPWWILELQGRYYVHLVRIWGRGDGYPQTLPLLVQISASGENWEMCSYLTSQETHGWPREAPCDSKLATRVKLTQQATNHLSLCEVEVFGVAADVTPGAQLISRGKPAQQSGEWSATGWAPMYAYYGNDGNYQANLIPTHVSCAITAVGRNPWWRVNLQIPHKVHDIHIYGRSDGYQQAMPLVIETSRDDNKYSECQTLTGREEPLMKANCKGVKATYVRITRGVNSDVVLSLCEVEIFGFPVIEGVEEELTFISRGKPSRQSSTYDWIGHMEARFANDGAYHTKIGPGVTVCAITEKDASVSWTVNLQGNFKVFAVHIWGRSDHAIQLLPLRVETSLNDWDYQVCGELTGTTVVKVYEVGCKGVQASFVRISRPSGSSQDHITLCEVDVIGKEVIV